MFKEKKWGIDLVEIRRNLFYGMKEYHCAPVFFVTRSRKKRLFKKAFKKAAF